MLDTDPLGQVFQKLHEQKQRTKYITSYTERDVHAMLMLLHQAGLTYEFRTDVQEIRCACPFHANHGSPTLWVNFGTAEDLPFGAFKCFSCGESGLWHKLEHKLTGTNSIGSPQAYDEAELLPVIELRKPKELYRPPPILFELDEGFTWEHPDGDFSDTFLRTLGSKLAMRTWFDKTVRQQFSELRLWLPVHEGDMLAGDIMAALERPAEDAEEFIKKGFKKYINSTSLEAKDTLWPLPDVVRRFGTEYIVLVEGPADAMRLILNGVPALACLGTGVWSQSKADKVYYVFKKICTCFDGDTAGRKLTQEVRQSLYERLNGKLTSINLPDGYDPGKFTAQDCAWLTNKITAE